jgi:plastocyanin
MNRPITALVLAAILLGNIQLRPASGAHCAPARVTPVPGDPGAFSIETPHGTTIARRPAPPAATRPPTAVCRVYTGTFDFDGDTVRTVRDTIVLVSGSIVRWIQYQPDFHTVTNGRDSGDPSAATEFNAILNWDVRQFDWTFTTPGQHDFFCYIHEPAMEGSIIVIPATADVRPGPIREASFTRPPAPNPTRGPVTFAVALPRTLRAQISVHDVSGRRVAMLEDAPLPPGEHSYRWDGRGHDGRMLPSGRYFVRLAAGGTVQSRALSLIR